jgi:hypothetical protein
MSTATATQPKFTQAQAETLYARAHRAGLQALEATVPTPMLWGSPSTPLGSDVDLSKPHAVSYEGPCGFAWVGSIKGNSSFGRWLVKTGRGLKDSYAGGVLVWVSEGGQSVERKGRYASAFAGVLHEAGVSAYPYSRMD